MSRRSKLLYLWSFNAILASAVVALVTMLLASGGSSAGRAASCAANDAPTTPESFIPVNNTFETIIGAETFICHQVAYPRSTPGWAMEHISASRSGPAAYVGRGLGFASVTLDYLQPNNRAADPGRTEAAGIATTRPLAVNGMSWNKFAILQRELCRDARNSPRRIVWRRIWLFATSRGPQWGSHSCLP